MARRWTLEEETLYRDELRALYVDDNKTIHQIGRILGIGESTVFKRMQRLGIESTPDSKSNYLNGFKAITIPVERSAILAEFLGIMLGDGHVSHFQTIVTLGTKELPYVEYVRNLMNNLFDAEAAVCVKLNGYRDVYIGSVQLTAWLREQGLVANKVASQVGAPEWIFEKPNYMNAFLRGFFDTDGSIYRLKFGKQISLTNHSIPLLNSLRSMLIALEYKPSKLSAYRVYLTRKSDVDRFFVEVQPANTKHLRRFEFISYT